MMPSDPKLTDHGIHIRAFTSLRRGTDGSDSSHCVSSMRDRAGIIMSACPARERTLQMRKNEVENTQNEAGNRQNEAGNAQTGCALTLLQADSCCALQIARQ